MNTTYRILGMRRSGNHCIINWLIKHLEKSANIELRNNITLDNGTLVDSEDIKRFQCPYKTSENINIHTYEDYYPNDLYNDLYDDLGIIDIMVIRDAYNCFASRINNDLVEMDDLVVDKWKSHIRNGSDNALVINYNKWFVSEEYRSEILNILGIPYIRNFGDTVPANGNGSSFDGLFYIDNPQDMKVLERYKQFTGNPEYTRFIDDEVIELCDKYFDIPNVI